MRLRDVIGKFVVLPEEELDPPVEKTSPAASPAAVVPPSVTAAPSTELPAGEFDLTEIYKQISPVSFSAEQALAILRSLPEGLSPEIQRQAFRDLVRKQSAKLGVPPESVMEDARRKVDLLKASIKDVPGQVAGFISASESEIANLEKQIRDRKKAIEQAQLQQHQITQKCRSEVETLTVVLQLLGNDPQI